MNDKYSRISFQTDSILSKTMTVKKQQRFLARIESCKCAVNSSSSSAFFDYHTRPRRFGISKITLDNELFAFIYPMKMKVDPLVVE